MTNKRKRQYRIRNWRDYNKALVLRGSLTLWLDLHAIETWRDHSMPRRRGRHRTYSDVAVLSALTLREVYHLPLRATEGLVRSLLRLLEVALPAPDYSTLSRRARHLSVSLAARRPQQIKHLVIDSTGLKLYGDGEWRAKMQGWAKRRTWRKLHLSVDASTQQVAAALITNKEVVDPRVLPRLLKHIEAPIGRVYADGAYDARGCYEAIYRRGARAVIPPRKGATLWKDEYLSDRNDNLRQVRRHGAAGWKERAKYHRRSLAETAIFRLKALFSEKLRSREVGGQTAEVMVGCVALNRMTELGMPRTVAV